MQVKKVKLPITLQECLQQKWFDQNQWKEHVLHSSLRNDMVEKAGKAQESREDDKTQCLSGKRHQDTRLSCKLNIVEGLLMTPPTPYVLLALCYETLSCIQEIWKSGLAFSLWSLSFILRTGICSSQDRLKLPMPRFALADKNTCLYFFEYQF